VSAEVVVLFLTVISAASVRYFFAIRRIADGIVAENSATCLSSGVSERIRSTSSAKAHLEHLVGLVEHQEAQLGQVEGALVEVVHDPAGVPTTTCTPRRRADSWTPYAWPP
jgi:hypothetical protein